jgi:hypothetical protein
MAKEFFAMLGPVPDDPAVDDVAGECASMLCGRWLSDVALKPLFSLTLPVRIELTLEG